METWGVIVSEVFYRLTPATFFFFYLVLLNSYVAHLVKQLTQEIYYLTLVLLEVIQTGIIMAVHSNTMLVWVMNARGVQLIIVILAVVLAVLLRL